VYELFYMVAKHGSILIRKKYIFLVLLLLHLTTFLQLRTLYIVEWEYGRACWSGKDMEERWCVYL